MRIDKLRLRNFRCFDEVSLGFDDKLTVIVALNGGGKTALLDAVAIALSPFVGRTGTAKGRKFQPGDARSVLVKADNTSARVPSPFQEISLEAAGEVDGEQVNWTREKRTLKGVTTLKDAAVLVTYADKLIKGLKSQSDAHEVILPIIAYYGTSRLWGPRQSNAGKGKKAIVPRPFGYQGCLSASSRFDSFSEWFRTANLSLQIGRNQKRERGGFSPPEHEMLEGIVRNVKDAVQQVLRFYGDCYLDYRATDFAITITDVTRLTHLELAQQSDGVQSILSMVGDIASRTSILNPQFGKDAARKTSGIVLIDEIDMHLHPAWQQVILKSLREAFPLIQFIVTTHSPQVLTTVPRENIRVVEMADTGYCARMPDFSPLAHESGDALAKIMGTHREPPLPIQEVIRNFEQLVRAGQESSEDAIKLRHTLDDAGYQVHDSDLSTWRFLAARKANRDH